MHTFAQAFVGLLLLIGLSVLPSTVIAQQDGGTIAFDQPVSGQITDSVPQIAYQFEGTAGDIITIQMQAIEVGLDSYLELRDVNGGFLVSDDDSGEGLNAVIGPYTLPFDGTYVIIASRCCGPTPSGSVGTFELTLTKAQLTPLPDGETITVELNDAQPSAFFSLDGEVGDSFSILGEWFEGSGGFNMSVRDPFGNFVNSFFGHQASVALLDPIQLNVEGTYQVVVNREAAFVNGVEQLPGNIRLGLTARKIETLSLTLNSPASGSLTDENPSDHFTFTASANDLLRTEGIVPQDSQPVELQILAPNGVFVIGVASAYNPQPGTLNFDPIQIPFDGEYLVILRRIDDGRGFLADASYTFTIMPSQTPVLESGVEVVDSVGGEQVFEKIYRFNGTEGQTVRVMLRSVDENYGPTMNVSGPTTAPDEPPGIGGGGGIGPGGNFVFSVNAIKPGTMTYELLLENTGVYLFRVNNGVISNFGPVSGQFGLTVEVVG